MPEKNYSTQQMIDALLMFHDNPESLSKYINEYRQLKEIPSAQRSEEDQKQFTKLARMIKIMFSKIKNKYENNMEKHKKEQESENVKKYVDDLKQQFKKQVELAKEEIEELEETGNTEEAKEKREKLKNAQEEFNKNKDKNFKTQNGVRNALIKPSNTVNNLISTIRKIRKYGKEYSPEEMTQRAKEKAEKEKEMGIKKGFRTVAKNIDREEKSKKLAKRFAKYAGVDEDEDEEELEPEDTKPNISKEKTKEVDIQKQINLIDQELESGNKNELDPDLANYAKKLANNIDTEEDKKEAKKAIDAVLDGYSLEEYQSEMVLTESRKIIKNKINKIFKG